MSHTVLSVLWLIAAPSSAQWSPVLLSHQCSRHPRVFWSPWVCLLRPPFLHSCRRYYVLRDFCFQYPPLNTHERTKPTALSQALGATYFPIRTIITVHQYKFRLCCSWLCPALCSPVDCSLPGPSVHGILQARIPEQLAISSSRGSSRHKDQICISCICWIGRRVLPLCHMGSPNINLDDYLLPSVSHIESNLPLSVETIAVLFIIVT